MATVHSATPIANERAERRFFFIMALVMAAIVVAGFSTNLAMGRSTFAVPAIYHMHAGVFFSWLVLYVSQNWLISSGNAALHRRLGVSALLLVPIMVGMGVAIMIASLRRSGGPFFFDQREFLVSNVLMLLLFAGFVFWGLAQRRNTGWHRRLMFLAMTLLVGPGLGRLLPMPLMAPHSWRVSIILLLVFPLIGIVADWRRGRGVHPAWLTGIALIAGVQLTSSLIAFSPLGAEIVHWVVEGTPGAARPMETFVPPGFGS